MVPEGPQQRPERVALLATLARRVDLARAVARLHLAVPAEQPEARVDRLGVVAVDRLVVEARHRDERGEEGAKAAKDGAARDRVEAVDLVVGEDGALGEALHEDAADGDENLSAARRPAAELQRRVAAPLARLLLRREAVVLARAPQVLPRRRGPRQPLADLVLNLLHDAPPDKAAESRADADRPGSAVRLAQPHEEAVAEEGAQALVDPARRHLEEEAKEDVPGALRRVVQPPELLVRERVAREHGALFGHPRHHLVKGGSLENKGRGAPLVAHVVRLGDVPLRLLGRKRLARTPASRPGAAGAAAACPPRPGGAAPARRLGA